MNPVISVNLNGNAYQLEDAGYAQLRAYLDRAASALKGNPDEAEILADLEQAIADKCQRTMGPHKTVITAAEIAQVLEEMGPVDAANGDRTHTAAGAPNAEPAGAAASADTSKPKRLYQIKDGAMISGVCTGIAAYLHVDVTLVRVAFLILTYWAGIGVIAYIALSVVLPRATTDEQVAAAHGQPFNARDIIDQAKRISSDIGARGGWRRHMRNERVHWRREIRRKRRERGWTAPHPNLGLFVFAGIMILMITQVAKSGRFWGTPLPAGVPEGIVIVGLFIASVLIFSPRGWKRALDAPAPIGAMTPILNLLSAAWLIALIVALVSIFKTGAILGWPIPSGVPPWAAAVGLLVVYQFVATPLMIARGAVRADAVASFIGMAILCWFLYEHVPAFRDAVERGLEQIRLSGLFSRSA